MRASIVLAAFASTAHADPAPPDTYTRSIVLSDAVSAALVASGYVAILHSDPNSEDFGGGYLMLFGAGGYLSIPAFIHHDAGHDGRAVLSGLLRAGLPIAAGLTANEFTGRNDVIAGAVIAGAAVAMVIDWTVLARPPKPAAQHAQLSGFGAPVRGGGIAGIAGSF